MKINVSYVFKVSRYVTIDTDDLKNDVYEDFDYECFDRLQSLVENHITKYPNSDEYLSIVSSDDVYSDLDSCEILSYSLDEDSDTIEIEDVDDIYPIIEALENNLKNK